MSLPPKIVLYKDWIELRLLSPRDGPAIFEAVKESLPSLKKFMHWAHYDIELAKACTVYADFEAKSLKGEEANFAGFNITTGEFLFCASLSSGSRLNPLAYEIGYWVASKHQNQGMGTIATKILTVLAFRYYGADRLSVGCNPENTASFKVIEKCGFHFEGLARNFQSKPTQEMIEQGLSLNTDISSFCLVPEDLSELPWFEEFSRDVVITPFYD
ncbi:MAG: GNAT family N-acetyltransferase [Parachlamydiales bacterium]|jgi:RimJ/RimL family protein N-acetyltransferase